MISSYHDFFPDVAREILLLGYNVETCLIN